MMTLTAKEPEPGTKINKINDSLNELSRVVSKLSSFMYELKGEAEPETNTDPPIHDSFSGVYDIIETRVNSEAEQIDNLRSVLRILLLG